MTKGDTPMKFNSYFCHINETKLTEAEWNEVHAKEVADKMFDMYGYWHCNSYVSYSASFDRCMKEQIERRDYLRRVYVTLKKTPNNALWDERYSLFSDDFKTCYGYRPNFRGNLLMEKGLPADTPWAC